MLVLCSPDAIVEAERIGLGRLPWAWVAYCEETGVALARSEAMFRTPAAALRIGRRCQEHLSVRHAFLTLH